MYGLYTITSASNNVSGGCVNSVYSIIGYKSNELLDSQPHATNFDIVGHRKRGINSYSDGCVSNLNTNSQSGRVVESVVNGFTGNASAEYL